MESKKRSIALACSVAFYCAVLWAISGCAHNDVKCWPRGKLKSDAVFVGGKCGFP